MFVAVVYNEVNGLRSHRPNGDYACFIAHTEEDAVEKAMKAKDEWEKPFYDPNRQGPMRAHGPYVILVGKLDASVKPTVQYTRKPL